MIEDKAAEVDHCVDSQNKAVETDFEVPSKSTSILLLEI